MTITEKESSTAKETANDSILMLSEALLKLKQSCSSNADNAILDSIDLKLIKAFEALAPHNPTIKSYLEKIVKVLREVSIEYEQKWEQIKQAYFECEAYHRFFPWIDIARIPEKKDGEKTPDFKFVYEGKDYFLECKSFCWESPSITNRADQEESLNQKIKLEEACKKGPGPHSSMRVVSPYDHSKKSSIYYLKPIMTLQEKLNNNLKDGQLDKENTFLFIDLSLLTISESPFSSINPFSISREKDLAYNSTLWTICCGKANMPLFGAGENARPGENFGYLRYDGLFHRFEKLDAVIFRVGWDKYSRKLVGIIREEKYFQHAELFDFIGVKYNSSERNEQDWMLNND